MNQLEEINCKAEYLVVDGRWKVVYVLIKDIEKGE
jgi:hypothetical protein